MVIDVSTQLTLLEGVHQQSDLQREKEREGSLPMQLKAPQIEPLLFRSTSM